MLPQVSFTNESWKDIPGFDDLYKVSDLGRIYSCKKQKIISPAKNNKGYFQIGLSKNGEKYRYQLGRIVGICFIRPPKYNEEINHKDGNKSNNKAENLEWKTHLGNMQHAVKTGLKDHKRGKHFKARKVLDTSNGKIYDCLADAAEKHSISEELLCMYLNGKRNNKTSLTYLN